jgi:membrane fusion protein
MTDTSASRPSLFRPESLRARQLAWQGHAVLALGLPAAFTTVASLALAAATGALVIFGSYAHRVDMQGAILPSSGVIAISAPVSAWITNLAVREGEPVNKDALLYTLDLDTATKDGSTQQQIIKVLTSEREMLIQQIDRKTR